MIPAWMSVVMALLSASPTSEPGGSAGARIWSEPPATPTYWDAFLEGVKSPADWTPLREDIRGRFLALLRDDQKPSKPALDLKMDEPVDVDGEYTRRRITYNVEGDERATAFLAIPARLHTPAPAIVALHGTSVYGKDIMAGFIDKPGYPDTAHLDHLARRGYVVIAPDHFNMGERTPAEGQYLTAPFYRRHPEWTAAGKIVYDAAIAIDVLCSLPEVDPKRIGALGHSLGGEATVNLAAYDGRIAVAASNCGGWPFQYNTVFKRYALQDDYVTYKHLQPLFERNKLPPVDVHEVIALIAPRPMLYVVALNDMYGGSRASSRQRAEMNFAIARLYQTLGASQSYSFYVHGENHTFEVDSRELVYAWMDKHLKPASETVPRPVSRPAH